MLEPSGARGYERVLVAAAEHLQPGQPEAEHLQAGQERRRQDLQEWAQEAERTFSKVVKVRTLHQCQKAPEAQATSHSFSPEPSRFIFFRNCGGDFAFPTSFLGLSLPP